VHSVATHTRSSMCSAPCLRPGIGEVTRSRTSPQLHHNMMLSAPARLEVATVICVSPTETYVRGDSALPTAPGLQMVLQQPKGPTSPASSPERRFSSPRRHLGSQRGCAPRPERGPTVKGSGGRFNAVAAVRQFTLSRAVESPWAAGL